MLARTQDLLIGVVLLLSFGPAAAINKCTIDGKVVYQDAPCENAKTVDLSGAGRSDPQSSGAVYWKSEAERIERQKKVWAAIAASRIFVGMTADEARQSWGRPTKINSSVGSYGKHEQWVYDLGNFRSQYVYVENGIVTSMQSPE